MTRTGLSFSAVVLVASLGTAACSKDPVPAQQPQPYAGGYQTQPGQPGQPGAYPQQPGAYPQQPGAYPQQPGTVPQQPGTVPQQPGTVPQQPGQPAPAGSTPFPGIPGLGGGTAPSGAGGGTAQAMDPNFAALAAGPLSLFANTEAPGMQKDGAMVAGNFQAGQTLEGTFTFQPGKCYTLVAQGVGITNLGLEMQYVTPLPGLAPSIGKSSQAGSQASIGGKANCLRPISPFPAQAKFIVTARTGAGMAAAQLFSK